MEENLAQVAINSALKCKWLDAISTNLLILKNDPEDIDSLNRLSHAYFENGNINKARATSKIALKIDPTNNIAKNAFERFKKCKPSGKDSSDVDTASFIEESGKTKITTLINLGSEKTYSLLTTGEEVLLVSHSHKVSVTTKRGAYIGRLADDLSARLRILIKEGNKYQVHIKSVNNKCIKIFIKGESISFPIDTSESFSEFSS